MGEQSFLEVLGLQPIINAAGRMTALGASTQSGFVRAAMMDAAARHMDMEALFDVADQQIADAAGAEAGFITSCSAAGIAIAAAACITRGERALVEQIPFVPHLPNEIVIQKGHAIHFGAELGQMIRIGGGEVIEIGTANRVLEHHLQAALTDHTAAVMFVVSHHTVQSGMLSLEQTIALAHARDVPVIVDAAAELDLRKYAAAGADLVIYSGHKGFQAPTSGILAGKRQWIDACRMQNLGVGRTMKIGKENIVGCLAALHEYRARGTTAAEIDSLESDLRGVPGIQTARTADATRPDILRLRLTVDPQEAGLNAEELSQKLTQHSPSIRTRAHGVERGFFEIDFRPLAPGEAGMIAAAIRALVEGANQG